MLLIACLVVASIGALSAQDLNRDELELLVTIPSMPVPVRAEGRTLLVYELHLFNAGSDPVTVTRLEVIDSSSLIVLQGEELERMFKPADGQIGDARRLDRGEHAVVMLFLSLDRVPRALGHQLTGEAVNKTRVMTLPPRPIAGSAVRIRPPLRGARWSAANGPSNTSDHRRSWLVSGGRAVAPERFATDFVQLTPAGELVAGDNMVNASYPGYGKDVLAVADGVVASVADGAPDNVPANVPPGSLAVDTIGGNSVMLDIGGGRFAWYAHMQPGIRVKEKQRVKAGDVLGKLGNSGNANGPHLHFQITDGPHPLFSDGLPYVFDAFVYKERKVAGEIPLQDWVVDFP